MYRKICKLFEKSENNDNNRIIVKTIYDIIHFTGVLK